MRTNKDGNDIRRVLEYALRREVPNREIAAVLGISESTYSRRQGDDTFPSFEDLATLAGEYGLVAAALQYDFGLIDDEAIEFLREHRSGHPTMTTSRKEVAQTQRARRVKTAKQKPPL